MINHKFNLLFKNPERTSEDKISTFYMDVAASIQKVLEYIVLKICKDIKKQTKQRYLCMAGGVALNCVANGKIIKEGIFDDIWVQPAAGDAGGALGAALLASHLKIKIRKKILKNKNNDFLQGSLLGPEFSNKEIFYSLKKLGAKARKFDNSILIEKTVEAISNNSVVGWVSRSDGIWPQSFRK
jgi:carbamoyltransferase